jgi:site-specific DNA recombinase
VPDKNSGNKSEIRIVPEEAEAVNHLFQMYSTGGHSLASLAVWLNEHGLQTRNKRELKDGSGKLVNGPRQFTLYSVRWLLHNPFYIGKVRYYEQLHSGVHEPIIDEALFNSVQARLKSAKNHDKTFSPSYRQYL